jgi:hypothetical protein
MAGPAAAQLPAGRAPAAVVVADADRDGRLDLIVANAGSNDLTVLLGDGTGGFVPAAASPVTAGHSPNDLSSADFNGDGAVDLAIANHDTQHVTVLLGDGRGGFAPAPGSPVTVQSRPHAHGVAAADVNGDAWPDLVVDSWQDDRVEVVTGDGSGRFATPGATFQVGRLPYYKVRLGDVNADGNADIVTTNLQGTSVSVLLGDGRGGFADAPGSPFSVPPSPFGHAIGDVSGDGHVDLVVVHYSGSLRNRAGDGVSVLLGDGRGGFVLAPGSPIAVGHGPVAVALGDVTGDGVMDIAAVNLGGDTVSVLHGGGSGFVEAPGSPFAVGRGPIAIAAADLDGDGRADIVAANSGDDAVTVLFSRAAGESAPP